MATVDSRESLEEVEVALLLEGMYLHYGYDFRGYALSSLTRRIRERVRAEGAATVSGLKEKVLHDPACMERLVHALSINVSSMYRDPEVYRVFRQKIVPVLRTYPFVRIWHAGCSTGEEVYSMAILLQEEGLYARSRLYATDMNETVIRRARAGIYPLKSMRQFTADYLRAGGKASFSEYYVADHESAVFRPDLKTNVVFAEHNLVTDGPFNEFHVVFCRNVMIYFDRELQARVHDLFLQSLVHRGYLCLGSKETLKYTPYEVLYEEVDPEQKIYRRLSPAPGIGARRGV